MTRLSKELRIGNLIMDDEGDLSTVKGVCEGEIMTAGVWLPEDKFNAVPLYLAKDILKMMGFSLIERGGKRMLIHGKQKRFYLELSNSGIYYYNGSGRGNNARAIFNVHNLQNLFFELYKTELLWNFRKLQ